MLDFSNNRRSCNGEVCQTGDEASILFLQGVNYHLHLGLFIGINLLAETGRDNDSR